MLVGRQLTLHSNFFLFFSSLTKNVLDQIHIKRKERKCCIQSHFEKSSANREGNAKSQEAIDGQESSVLELNIKLHLVTPSRWSRPVARKCKARHPLLPQNKAQ